MVDYHIILGHETVRASVCGIKNQTGFSSLYAVRAASIIHWNFTLHEYKCFIEQTHNEGLLDAKNVQQ